MRYVQTPGVCQAEASECLLNTKRKVEEKQKGNEMNYKEVIAQIIPLDEMAMEESAKHWNSIVHPLHSLGKLEEDTIRMSGMMRTAKVAFEKKALVVMCADNGIVEEGVTQSGQEVTAIVSENFLREQATVAIMCKKAGVDIFPVDIGMASDTEVPRRKTAYGTKNFVKEPAMTREECIRSIETGMEIAAELKEKGYGIVATGEMGIGNTTTASAILSVMLSKPAEQVTGYGAGLSQAGLEKKIQVIKEGVGKWNPNPEDAIDVLSKVGGFDIAGLAGLMLGCAANHLPVVLDGVISAAAALCAAAIEPQSRQYMIASHVSKETAGEMVLEALELDAGLHLNMCLGEGTGAILYLEILETAIRVYHSMSTFEDVSIEQYEDYRKA